MVSLQRVQDNEEISELKQFIENHFQYTGSTVAQTVLSQWETSLPQFVKVMPNDYMRYLEEQQERGMETAEVA